MATCLFEDAGFPNRCADGPLDCSLAEVVSASDIGARVNRKVGCGKQVLPPRFKTGAKMFSIKRIGLLYRTKAFLFVFRVLCANEPNLSSQPICNADGK